MKRWVILIIVVFLLLSLSFFVYGDREGQYSNTFRVNPITKGICEETAYTLGRGEWKVGDLSVPWSLSQWRHFYLNYGLSDNLQIGTTLSQNFLGRPNISAKYHLPFDGPGGARLAVPARVELNISPLGASTHTGLTASWDVNDRMDFHTGVDFWLVSYVFSAFNTSAYFAADYNLFSNMKVIGELDFYSFGQNFLTVRVGGLLRVLDFVNLRASSSLRFPSGGTQVGADLFFRF